MTKYINQLKFSFSFCRLTKRSQREAVSPEQRLALTLRYLATGISFRALAYSFRLGRATVHNIIKETTDAMQVVLSPVYLRTPTTEAEWLKISVDFEKKWHMPHAIGNNAQM